MEDEHEMGKLPEGAGRLWGLHTNAVPEPSGERDVGVGVPTRGVLRQEAFRSEELWLWEIAWVPVQGVGDDNGVGPPGDLVAFCNQGGGGQRSGL